MSTPTLETAIEVVTEGPAAGNVAHRRYHDASAETKYTTPATSSAPLCLGKPEKDADLSGWRQYSLGRAVELGAEPCTEAECFGGAA